MGTFQGEVKKKIEKERIKKMKEKGKKKRKCTKPTRLSG